MVKYFVEVEPEQPLRLYVEDIWQILCSLLGDGGWFSERDVNDAHSQRVLAAAVAGGVGDWRRVPADHTPEIKELLHHQVERRSQETRQRFSDLQAKRDQIEAGREAARDEGVRWSV